MVKIFDRLLLFIYSLVVGVALLVFLYVLLGFVKYAHAENYLNNLYYEPAVAYPMIAVSIGLVLVSARLFYIAVRRSAGRRPSIERRTDTGVVSISIDTIQNLALKAAGRVSGLSEIKSRIRALDSKLAIDLRAAVDGELSIPQLTEELQQSVKSYVEEIAGIEVAEVSVYISHVADKPAPALFTSRTE